MGRSDLPSAHEHDLRLGHLPGGRPSWEQGDQVLVGAPHITKTHDVLADVGCMSLPGTDPVPALRAAQRCGATPILWATGQPIANQLDPLVVWADVPPDGPLPPNVKVKTTT